MGVQNFVLISSFFLMPYRGYRGFDFFSRTLQNCYKMQTYNLIATIFGTNEERVTVDSRTKFVVNLSNIQGVMSIYSRKKRPNFLSRLQGKPSKEIT